MLETQIDFEVVGAPEQAASGEEALRLATELQPHICCSISRCRA